MGSSRRHRLSRGTAPHERKYSHRKAASEPQDRSSSVAHSIEVPSEIIQKWQEFVNLLAEIMHVPSASIMRADPPHIKVFVSSTSKGNPCEPGALDTGPYCETVMKTGQPLLVPDALENEAWKANPHVRLGMISYLGVPISWPDGRLFGTICVRDNKRNEYSEAYLKLLLHFREMLQVDLKSLVRLHGEIEEREAKIRRLVDANIIGIFIWDFDGRILEANEAFLHIVGYDHEDLVAGRIRWTDLTPPEWRDRDTQLIREHKATGTLQPFEKEYFRKDGSRVPVLIGVATFEEGENQGVAFVLDLTERKRAEETLRASEHTLRQILETVPSLLWSTDPDGEVTYINQRILGYLGTRLEDFKHRGWEPFVHPADLPETAKAFSQALQTGTSHQAVHRLRRSDGEYRWHHTRAEPLHDQQGRIIQWYGQTIDIDEGKRAEEQLRRSEANLAEAQRLSKTGSWAINPAMTKILYWSEECYRIWGFDPVQGLPNRETAWRRIHPGDQDRMYEETQEALRQKRDYTVDFRIVLPDGTVKYLEAIGHHRFSADGELVQVVGTNVDVTERKRAEEALRESEARSRSVIDGIAGLVVILAPNGEVETVNRQVFEYFGRSLEWLKNWGTNDAIHPEDLPRIAEIFQRSIATGTPFHYELRLRHFDGEYRWFDTRHVPIRDDSGRIARWYILATDIEDRTRALAQLDQMQSDFAHMNRVSMMGEWAAELSHEITQPIASARNNARAAQNFLDKRPPDLGEAREALSCVVGDADRAGDIVDRVRDHIKKAPPRKAQFDLNEAINEVIVLGRSAAIRNGVSVQTRLSEGLFPIHGDRVQLQQVVLNLLLNAVEAMGSTEAGARELLISTEQDQDHRGVLVAVRDSGPGIDPSHLERVFDAFYTTKSSGMGMGLSICRSIIDAHGGRLWAEANEPRGTIFQFTLPAVQVGP